MMKVPSDRSISATGTAPTQESHLEKLLATRVRWTENEDPVRRWVARVGSEDWIVSIGDFPDEPLYTLTVDGNHIGDFDDWPSAWTR